MAEIIPMPKLSDTMEEGVIAKWTKKEGDSVSEGDILAEIETDKATMEYEAPTSGVVLKLLAAPGKRVKIKDPICVIGAKGEKFDSAAAATAPAAPAAPPAAKAASPAPEKKPVLTDVSHVSQVSAPTAGRVKSSPLAKKMAAERGINLAQLQGSGPGGRIVARDLSGGGGSAPTQAPNAFTGSAPQDTLVPVTMMRQTIAKRLHAAKNDAPHFYLTVSCNMTAVNRWREKLNAGVDKDQGIKVSVNDIIMLACAKALRRHPQVNAAWEGENIRQSGAVHVAMAVALPSGLITPVIRHCDQLGIRQIAETSRALAGRAKAGALKSEDYTGGTFTVSNLGMLGIEDFTAIINPPQAAILAVGRTMNVPWVDGDEKIIVQPRMKMTMSCDHRVVDGALGAQFLQTLVAYIDDPVMMLS